MRILLVSFLLLILALQVIAEDYKVFCYWNGDSFRYKNDSQFLVSNDNLKLCTHLAYGHLRVQESGIIEQVESSRIQERGIWKNALHYKSNKLAVLISVGGWKQNSKYISDMMASSSKRDLFFSSVIDFIYEWHFNGIDLDWFYPMLQSANPQDRVNFVIFLEELKIILREHNMLLSVSVAAFVDRETLAIYDIPKIVRHVDIVNLITFDVRKPKRQRLAYIAPLHGGDNSVEHSVYYWIRQSGTPSKLLLGIPLFAQTYTLSNSKKTNVGARSTRPGRAGKFTNQPGFMAYNEFCVMASTWTQKYDEAAQAPYAYKNDQWLSYENARSIHKKLHFLKSLKLGGAAAYTIDVDDHRGHCGEYFGLLRVINVGTEHMIEFTTKTPTTDAIGMCPREGYFRHPWNCRLFHRCLNGERTEYECFEGMYFDEKLGHCNPAHMVSCNKNHLIWKSGMDKYNYRDLPLNLGLET